jgi:uncharacterized protein (DUF433 family)
MSIEEVVDNFPKITHKVVLASFAYADVEKQKLLT